MTMDLDSLVEQAQIMEQVAALKAGSTLGGLLVDGANKGAMTDISDPMTLVPLYATATGERREVPVWTLEGKNSILLRKHEDGTKVFSSTPPRDKAWQPGQYPCLLAASHPDRAKYVGMGLGLEPCKGEHLANPFQVERHMKNRHSQEYETIKEEEAREERAFQREWMKAQTAAANAAITPATRLANAHGSEWLDGMAGADGAEVVRIVSHPIVEPDVADGYDANGVTNTLTCDCGWMTIKGQNSLKAHKRLHCPLKGTA